MEDFIYQDDDKAQPTFNETTESSEPKSLGKQFDGKLLRNPNNRRTALVIHSRQSPLGLKRLSKEANVSSTKVLFKPSASKENFSQAANSMT